MLMKCLGRENSELIFGVAPKGICGPLIEVNTMCLAKKIS